MFWVNLFSRTFFCLEHTDAARREVIGLLPEKDREAERAGRTGCRCFFNLARFRKTVHHPSIAIIRVLCLLSAMI